MKKNFIKTDLTKDNNESNWGIDESKIFVSKSCNGEICSVCSLPATNKLGEEIPFDDPDKNRHNLTAYVCRKHFTMIVGGC
jgi:hypothetical protein